MALFTDVLDSSAVNNRTVAWTDFSESAVLTWDVTPSGVNIINWKYRIINGICYFVVEIVATDGKNVTSFTSTLPVNPAESMTLSAQQLIGNGALTPLCAGAATYDNTVWVDLKTGSDGLQLYLGASGFYPV